MTRKTYNFGIVGPGYAGLQHIEAIQNHPRAILKAICSRNIDILQDLAEETGATIASKEFEDILNAGIDVLIVSTPDHLHTDYAHRALTAGINVLCEKPLATTLTDAQLLVHSAEKSGKIFMTGHCARFYELSALARSTVEKQELGNIFYAEASFLFSMDESSFSWHEDPKDPMNIVLSAGCHPIDLLRWLVGDIEEVHAFANKKILPPSSPIEQDCVVINLKYKNDAIGRVLISIGCQGPDSINFGLYGSRGTMINNHLYLSRIPKMEDFMDIPLSETTDNAFEKQLEHVLDCLDNNTPPLIDAREGAKNVATCLAIIESIKTGRVIKVTNEF